MKISHDRYLVVYPIGEYADKYCVALSEVKNAVEGEETDETDD